jgi:hypothetical protein
MHKRATAAIFLGVVLAAFARCAAAAPIVKLLGFSSADFEILDPATLGVIGHAHYVVMKEGSAISLHGDDRYTNGEYDYERDRFEPLSGALPVLVQADHYFFLANGAPQLRSNLDLKAGLASCTDFRTQPPVTQSAALIAPADTWAGASVMIPIQDFLRRGGAGTLDTHVFNCAPSPKIFAVKVTVTKLQALLPLGRRDLVEVDVKPDFGWLNLLIEPFVPHLNAWFDPHQEWEFVGAALARFYKGPDIMLARVAAPDRRLGASEPAPPR